MTDFDTFWAAYPRKVGKLACRDRYWPRALKEGTPEAIIAGLEAQLPKFRATEHQFIPHPSTWLNEGRWMDGVEHPTKACDRSYSTWTETEKVDIARLVSKFGERFATYNARYLQTDIDQLRKDGFLQPRSVEA